MHIDARITEKRTRQASRRESLVSISTFTPAPSPTQEHVDPSRTSSPHHSLPPPGSIMHAALSIFRDEVYAKANAVVKLGSKSGQRTSSLDNIIPLV